MFWFTRATHEAESGSYWPGSGGAVCFDSAPDTDFTAKLIDVFPNGEARNLTDGLLRVRYRNGLEKAELA